MKKIMSTLMALAIVAMTGCGATPSTPSSTPASGAASTTTSSGDPATKALAKDITVAMALNENEWDAMKQVFAKFTEKTGIKVNDLHVEHADMENKVESLHKAGKAEIDIVAPDNMMLYGLAKKGLVQDLSTYESLIPQNVPKSLYEGFKVEGKMFFMPYHPNVMTSYYNEKKFTEAGIAVPEDWDGLLAMAKGFYDKEGVARYVFQADLGGPTTVTLFEFIRSAGGDPVVLNDAGSIEAFTFLQKLWPYTSPESKRARSSQINTLLANETAYYGANWPFAATALVKENGKTEMKPSLGVKGPKGYNKVLGGNLLAVTAITQKIEESKMFIEFMMGQEAQAMLCEKLGWVPIRDDAMSTIEEWQKPYFDICLEAMKYAEPRPNIPYFAAVDDAVNNSFKEIVVDGNTDIKGILDKYSAKIAEAKAGVGA